MSTLIFDIETIPDIEGLRRQPKYSSFNMDDETFVQQVFEAQKEKTGSEFLPLPFHRVVTISGVLRTSKEIRLFSLSEPDLDEKTIITRFFAGIDKYLPQLVSWNGQAFDMPVLHYRSLLHGVEARYYWDQGNLERDFRYSNYTNRYHEKHLDLMDKMALYNPRAYSSLDQLAHLLSLPGKQNLSGAEVWPAWCEGKIEDIRRYCESDVLNTWLLFLAFQRFRGLLSTKDFYTEHALTRNYLTQLNKPEWYEFLAAWPDEPGKEQVNPCSSGEQGGLE